jgi:7,8-dihydropterin-6-yl-methyl-4-(beta-D-ribofuranosyl)aminobenzene 5'-phosphate synthase
MGKSRLFLENAGKMGVDLTKVDTGILSHGHYDHGGGLAAFLAANEAADVYASERAFEPHFARRADGRVEFIGVDPEPTANPRLKKVGRALELDEKLTLFSGVDAVQNRPPANRTLLMRVAGSYVPDDFAHEQHLIVRENGEDVLFTGCAHGGILNILEAAVQLRGRAPRAVVGGFHLFLKPGEGGDNLDFALRTAEALKRYGAVYYPVTAPARAEPSRSGRPWATGCAASPRGSNSTFDTNLNHESIIAAGLFAYSLVALRSK